MAEIFKMDSEEATQATQRVVDVDPRRQGRNNSGLSNSDIADVMCILHPCSPAAFSIVANTAEQSPQNVLQRNGFDVFDDGVSESVLQEQETFILGPDGPNHAMDLALRFSVMPINPSLGFVFGRNAKLCDIVLANDTLKRVSNIHFSIFVNGSGVLMLRDMSTNGTMVDDVLLKGKLADVPQTRMLNPGSIIQILSPKPGEIVKFIVRIPPREGHIEEYEARFHDYVQRATAAEERAKREAAGRPPGTTQRTQSRAQSIAQPLKATYNQYGMHWGGGDKYNVVGLIGKGAFATVFQLATKDEGQLFAAKELEKRKFMKNGVLDRKLDNEMQIMKAISHPNIVQYVDYQDHANHLYIIMEFIPGGDLQQYLTTQGSLTEPLGKTMAEQVLEALSYLHAKKITHRDIKPDNILIADMNPNNFSIKLSDFGLSKVVKDNDTFLKTFCGTLLYCAPEVFPHYDAHVASRGQKRQRRSNATVPLKFHSYSQTVDVWSFGAVLWFSLCRKPPFEGVADATGRGMFEKIMMTPLDSTDLIEVGISDEAVSLLAEMLNTDPSLRPSPADCLNHPWFGPDRVPHPSTAEAGLGAIVEEEEAEPGAAPNVAALRIGEQDEDSGSSQYDEVSIHSQSMNFFDPRKSKRFKSEAFAYRDSSQNIGSSPIEAPQEESIPIGHQPNISVNVSASDFPQPPQRKLFGEISQSQLNAPGGLGVHANEHTENERSHSQQENRQIHPGASGSPSLMGAESLMRDVHMESPRESSGSFGAEPNEPTTPPSPERPNTNRSTNGSKNMSNGNEQITPKAANQAKFSRQINIPISASFFYDPNDPTTHNLEHASKVSGYDFSGKSEIMVPSETSLPSTQHHSAVTEDDGPHDDTDAEYENEPAPVLGPSPTVFIKPPPRLGRLTTTPDSFTSITMNLTTRSTTWGRGPSNTFVYPESHDTRIPKRGIILQFYATNIDNLPENADWTKLPDLHTTLNSDSNAIRVNGVALPKSEPGKNAYGRVYTGDEIVVWRKGQDCLKFTCEFFHGEGKERRPANGPKFKVEFGAPVEKK